MHGAVITNCSFRTDSHPNNMGVSRVISCHISVPCNQWHALIVGPSFVLFLKLFSYVLSKAVNQISPLFWYLKLFFNYCPDDAYCPAYLFPMEEL